MTTDELFEEYMQQLSTAEKRAYLKQGIKKLFLSDDFKKYCEWRKVAYDLKLGKRKMRRIAESN